MAEKMYKVLGIKEIPSFSPSVDGSLISPAALADCSDNIAVLPGFCDVHVHFREPGFSYKQFRQVHLLLPGAATQLCVQCRISIPFPIRSRI